MSSVSWKDPLTGMQLSLPYYPSSRQELEEMLRMARITAGAKVEAPLPQALSEGVGLLERGFEGGKKLLGQGAEWLMNSAPLKGAAEALRDPETREMARERIPGLEALEAIPGAISGYAGLVGAGIDRPINEVDPRDLEKIVGREYNEGLPALMEQVAPIDIATVGLGGAASLARGTRAFTPLARAAQVADVSEGLFGGSQVISGIREGNLPEVGIGAARLAGGMGGLVSGPKPDVEGRLSVDLPEMEIPDVSDYTPSPLEQLTQARKVEVPDIEEFNPETAAIRPEGNISFSDPHEKRNLAIIRLERLVKQADERIRGLMENVIGEPGIEYSGHELLQTAYGRTSTDATWVNDLQAIAEDAKSLDEFANAVASNLVHEQGYHSAGKLHGAQNVSRDADGNFYYMTEDGTKVIVPEETADPTNYAARSQYGESSEFGAHTQGTAVANNPDIIAVKERLRDAIINSPELWDALRREKPVVGRPFDFGERDVTSLGNQLYDAGGPRVTIPEREMARPKSPADMTSAELLAEAEAMEQGDYPKFELAASFRRMAEQKARIEAAAATEDAQRLQPDETQIGGDVQLQNQLRLVNNQLNNTQLGTPEYDHLISVKESLEAELAEVQPPSPKSVQSSSAISPLDESIGLGEYPVQAGVQGVQRGVQPGEAAGEPGEAYPLGARNLSDLDKFEAIAESEYGADWRDTAPKEVRIAHNLLIEAVNRSSNNPLIDVEAIPVQPPGRQLEAGPPKAEVSPKQITPTSLAPDEIPKGKSLKQILDEAFEESEGGSPIEEAESDLSFKGAEGTPRIKASERPPVEPVHVPLAKEDASYTYHSTDRAENLEGILKDGLREGHVSNVKGQGTSGPYILVYGGRQTGLTPVEHRPGDYMGKVKGKPRAIIVDPEAFVESDPIEKLLKKAEDLSAKRDAYVDATYPDLPKRKITRRQWNEELGLKLDQEYDPDGIIETTDWSAMTDEYRTKYLEDRRLRNLERQVDEAQDEYLTAMEKEDYKPKSQEDYFTEAKAIADKYGIPVIRGKMNDDGNIVIPEGSLKGLTPESTTPPKKPTLEAKSTNTTEFHFDKLPDENIRKQFLDGGFEEIIDSSTGKVTYRKGPKRGQSFNEFMQEKFGDRSTTSKERALARAEWNRKKEERKLLKMAQDSGIPPEKMQELLDSAPKGDSDVGNLSAWRRAAMPVMENLRKVHPWFGERFKKYIDDAETPAMKNIADSWRIKRLLSKEEKRLVVDILDGKKFIDKDTPVKVRQAAINYRAMLDQTWTDAIAAGVRKAGDRKRQTYFPHRFAEGWEDDLVKNLYLDKNWDLQESNLEKARRSKRADYRRDLDVLDEYFLAAYRRISEVNTFGKRLQELRRFAKGQVADKPTAEWLQTNIRRIMGREHPTGFDRFSGHARHMQAITDLGFAAFYQPIQASNTALYGGLGRSLRALKIIAENSPDEIYDAIRSRALFPDITQELVAGAYGAREGIPTRALQKFMWGIPTVDRWTRIHANTVGKLMVGDAMKGDVGALRDIKALGFEDITDFDALKRAMDKDPDFALKVGKELSDKALFRSGAMELPGWASSTTGKLATQYMRFMYRHALFVRDIFDQAGKGNVRPLVRFLTVAPTVITGMAEVLYPVREGIREAIREGVEGEDIDAERITQEALGDEMAWDDEIKWYHVLRNKRIPWTHPLKRALQNLSMWGGIGVFQVALERILGATGSPIEVGAKAITGAVPGNVIEGVGSIIKDVNRLPEDIEWDQVPFRNTRRWGVQQAPIVGYPAARRMKSELWE